MRFCTFNRTTLELKWHRNDRRRAERGTFNRTTLELKLRTAKKTY